ncbi:DUF1016 N-terminal domain-containing protein [Thiofilum flexile]|uniref:DUF1016 N-terminal domain-containing protein n=1 Tax=Thiofilum flexile TaxID=125627 RepID=UPI00039F3512|nr:DUF1016 N-terminal domain-containing protein [Thiofilum flexile]
MSPVLSWSHYNSLLHISKPKARAWYAQEAMAQSWSVNKIRKKIADTKPNM